MCVSSDGLMRLHFCAGLIEQMRAYVVFLDQSDQVSTEAYLLLVAYSHSLFQTSIILFDLLLVPVTVQRTTVFNQFHFFVKKVIIK